MCFVHNEHKDRLYALIRRCTWNRLRSLVYLLKNFVFSTKKFCFFYQKILFFLLKNFVFSTKKFCFFYQKILFFLPKNFGLSTKKFWFIHQKVRVGCKLPRNWDGREFHHPKHHRGKCTPGGLPTDPNYKLSRRREAPSILPTS